MVVDRHEVSIPVPLPAGCINAIRDEPGRRISARLEARRVVPDDSCLNYLNAQAT